MNTHACLARGVAVRRWFAAGALACASASACAASSYHVDLLEGSGLRYGSGSDINDSGQVVGTTGNTHEPTGVIWTGLQPTYLSSSLCCTYTETHAYAVNAYGQVAGVDTYGAAVWTNQTARYLPVLGGNTYSTALGINDAGAVVGYTGQTPGIGITQATLWRGDTATELVGLGGSTTIAYDINTRGWAVGSSELAGSSTTQAVLWHDGVTSQLANDSGGAAWASAINDADQVAGTAGGRAAVWKGGELSFLDAFGSNALDINDLGQAVGNVVVDMESGLTHAMLWSGGKAIDLNSFLAVADRDAGWVLETANAINDHGWITGSAWNPFGEIRMAYRVSLVSAVPEPGTLAMLAVGVALLAIASRRRSIGRASART